MTHVNRPFQGSRRLKACLLALVAVPVACIEVMAAEAGGSAAGADRFDLLCTTTMDRVQGTLADGSPVVATAIGKVRRYTFDLPGMRYAIGSSVTPIHAIDGNVVVKADPDAIESFSGVVHMQSDWRLDLSTGLSVRKNRFFADASGSRVTGNSEWHQTCERAPFSGMPAG